MPKALTIIIVIASSTAQDLKPSTPNPTPKPSTLNHKRHCVRHVSELDENIDLPEATQQDDV